MKKALIQFLFSGIVAVLFCVDAGAAPTVKKLGTVAATNTATAKSNTAIPSRAASVRFDTAKPVTAAPQKVSSTETDSTRLLPSGKYLQVKHSVKTDTTSGTGGTVPTPSSEEMLVIKDKITAAEGDIETLKQDLADHIDNADTHVTVSEKEVWNEKQDSLTAGPGIKIEDKVISSIMKLPSGSEDGPRTVPMWVE